MCQIYVQLNDIDGPERGPGLRDFGFDEAFLRDYLEVAAPGDLPGRVVEVQRGRYGLVLGQPEGPVAEAQACLSGRLLHAQEEAAYPAPAVGDWVVAKGGGTEATITAILPRRSAFTRRAPEDRAGLRARQVLAANVDTAFIVAAADARWSARRIERYLTLAHEAGVEAVVVITKADRAEAGAVPGKGLDDLVEECESLGTGLRAVPVWALEGRGLEGLSPWLKPGRTVVLLGSSGAGKSTLLNALAGTEVAATQAVRGDDDRGRHTTTHRELHRLPSGALVIDNPGLREVQLQAGEEAVAETFPEIEALAASCRFRDCSHGSEPGCALRAALESGEVDEGRYRSWLKQGREVAYLAAREDPRLAAEEAARWKAINKSMRGYSKERRSIQGRSR